MAESHNRHQFALVPADSTERATNSRGTVAKGLRSVKHPKIAVTSALTRHAARCLFSVNIVITGALDTTTSVVTERLTITAG